jgi:O-antigen biosynthesis protein WbqP
MLKRLFDLALALLVIILLLPVLLLVFFLVRLTSNGPALYWSKCVGKNNMYFMMPKFRSMLIDAPAVATHLLKDPSSHLTQVRGFLRKTSLDELPQLWSILKGNMSFVGPRPVFFNQDD